MKINEVAKSQQQMKYIYAMRSKYGTKRKAPKNMKWVFDEEWTSGVKMKKLPKKVKKNESRIMGFESFVNEHYEFEDFTMNDMEFVKELWEEGITEIGQLAIESDLDKATVTQIIYTLKKRGDIKDVNESKKELVDYLDNCGFFDIDIEGKLDKSDYTLVYPKKLSRREVIDAIDRDVRRLDNANIKYDKVLGTRREGIHPYIELCPEIDVSESEVFDEHDEEHSGCGCNICNCVGECHCECCCSDVSDTKSCKWCDKEFTPENDSQYCCCGDCDSQYHNYLSNDNSKTPWSDDKYNYQER